ncbi:isocitrate/isopropylmalate dehydrogenase family protein [Tepidibacter formicigenes]|jgi:isocitrate dehydrogenase (NAD+)|uniref:Isocitrate dehydrogenase (NAD+) n=1 Tax=Tepidibacter formicigenes DSM 15518 TaxID=1123349 RepID=A0A1M6M2K1_9FIRM|nr:isocitrate/isopropylmalate dehydrogenase family protein [Tepidibacter formicigenes]SHJ77665.1 isocitrate dehydrogenase (NAD+) [Tepidibacter formicigenes DSM 15518]
MAKTVTLIHGDGIGPEVISVAKKIIDASGANIEWEEVNAGESVLDKYKTPLPDYVIESIKKNKVALKGPITTPVGGGFRSVNVALRQTLNLYANVRPIKSYEGIYCLHKNVDFIIVRENTEGLYAGIEHMVGDDAAESIKVITKKASNKIVKFAFELAKKDTRKKVTAVHKANIMKLSDGLFLRCFKNIANEYNNIISEDVIVDAMSMKLVQTPQNYDVIVAPNLYGDILSDMAAGLVGGLGLAPGANIGDEIAVFEPVHGTAPDIAGKNLANPISAILSSIMMLKHIDEYEAALKIENAISKVFKKNSKLTKDLGGNLGTKEFAQEIIKNI